MVPPVRVGLGTHKYALITVRGRGTCVRGTLRRRSWSGAVLLSSAGSLLRCGHLGVIFSLPFFIEPTLQSKKLAHADRTADWVHHHSNCASHKATVGEPSLLSSSPANLEAGQRTAREPMLRAPILPSHAGPESPREPEFRVPCPAGSPTSSSTIASSHPSMTDLAGLSSSNSIEVPTRRGSPVESMLGIEKAAGTGVSKRHRRSYSAPLHGGRWDQLIQQARDARLAIG